MFRVRHEERRTEIETTAEENRDRDNWERRTEIETTGRGEQR